ncbi:hypothetical protein [Natrinema salinisoli]|nr:hypothetical protein [Natrinema salinisoli]
MTASSDDGDDDSRSRPQFRGCLFCYGGEWLAYSARTAARKLRRHE